MPLNPRQEAFCIAYRELGVARHAYRAAGYTASATTPHNKRSASVDRAAWQLRRNMKVRERLQELAAMAANRHVVSIESVAKQLDAAYQQALITEQPGAAVAAAMGKAKLYGLVVNKSESGRPGDFDNMRTTAELLDAVRNELGEAYATRLAKLFEDSPSPPGSEASDTTKLLPAPVVVDTFESSGVEQATVISTG